VSGRIAARIAPSAAGSVDGGRPSAVGSVDGGRPSAVGSVDGGLPSAAGSVDGGRPSAAGSVDGGLPSLDSRAAGPTGGARRPHLNEKKYPFLNQIEDAEKNFLCGKRSRPEELESAVRFFLEFLRGFESLDFEGPCVTVFGSARFPEGHVYYEQARALGRRLAEEGYVVMTGGGPGIMEAANRGAKEGGGLSLGCNIKLPSEQQPNPYLDDFVELEYFFVRKVILVKYSCAFVVMPGGFGTLDETFEVLTLVQTGKLENFPIVSMGENFWSHLRTFVENSLVAEQTIAPEDLDLIHNTDDVEEALRIIRGHR
jgi:hypothetical protein